MGSSPGSQPCAKWFVTLFKPHNNPVTPQCGKQHYDLPFTEEETEAQTAKVIPGGWGGGRWDQGICCDVCGSNPGSPRVMPLNKWSSNSYMHFPPRRGGSPPIEVVHSISGQLGLLESPSGHMEDKNPLFQVAAPPVFEDNTLVSTEVVICGSDSSVAFSVSHHTSFLQLAPLTKLEVSISSCLVW